MPAETVANDMCLKRSCLGFSLAPGGAAYVADPEGQCVHVLDGERLVEALKTRRIAARQWHVVVPREDCLVKVLSLPAADEAEARQMLEFEVRDLLPAHSGDMCYDMLDLGVACEGNRFVLVVLTPLERLQRSIRPLTEAGIVPETIVCSCVALHHWWRGLNRQPPGTVHSLVAVADRQRCHMLLESQGRLVSSRDMLTGPGGLRLAEQVAETQRMLRRLPWINGSAMISKVFCVAPADLLALQCDREPVSAVPAPAFPEVVPVQPQVRVLARTEGPEPSMIDALAAWGACLRGADRQARLFNLIPREWMVRRQWRHLWIDRAITAGTAVLVILALCLCLLAGNMRLERQRDSIARQIEPIREVAIALETKKNQVRAIQSQLARRRLPLELLLHLHTRMPENVYISQLTMDLQGSDPEVSLRGTAASLDLAFAFPVLLEKSALVKDVRSDGAQQVTRGKDILVEYGCRCRIDLASLGRSGFPVDSRQIERSLVPMPRPRPAQAGGVP